MISDEEIVRLLREKEQSLVSQLEKVRVALSAYTLDYKPIAKQESAVPVVSSSDDQDYDQFLSYDQKVVLSLQKIQVGYIDNMRDCLISLGDHTEPDKLYKGLTAAASRLFGKEILKADTRGRKYKYSLNPNKEKERADILPL
jgi:hypothetical protein